jgi:iron complex transport system permease protein
MLAIFAGWSCQLEVFQPKTPRPRIVSFSPAITDIIFAMGLGDHVVGVTQFCDLPEGITRPRVGTAFSINSQLILSVQPDLILAQTCPSKFKGVRDIRPDIKVYEISLERLSDLRLVIERIAQLTGRSELAKKLNRELEQRFEAIRTRTKPKTRPRTLFVMGTDRPTVAGPDNFVHDLIELAGGINVGADIPGNTRWRRTHIDAIAKIAPEVIVCQVSAKGAEEAAKTYWMQWQDLPAARKGLVYATSDPRWTIPSTHLTHLGLQLADILRGDADKVQPIGTGPSMTLWWAWLYRLLAAAIVGAALSVSGMALQGLLRNPLAEPYVLGISSGAGVGVLLGLALSGWSAAPIWASTPMLAFVGSMATCALVYAIAQRRGKLDPYSLILSGVIVNSFNAAIMLTIYLYIDPHRIADYAHWAIGRLGDTIALSLLISTGLCVLGGWCILFLLSKAFNVLTLGEEVAVASGVAVNRLRIATFLCVGLMTAAAVALAGPIGFLGLIVPHICRMIFGPDHRIGMLASGLVGAIFLMAAESLCRFAGPWVGVSLIPVGILTALAGGPFFIYLLRTRFGEMSS